MNRIGRLQHRLALNAFQESVLAALLALFRASLGILTLVFGHYGLSMLVFYDAGSGQILVFRLALGEG